MDGMSTSRFMDQFLVQGPRNDTANRPPAEGSIQESEGKYFLDILKLKHLAADFPLNKRR